MTVSKVARSILLCFTLLCTLSAFPQHQHSTPKKSVVDGALRPDLIPDGEVYRAVFASIANKPDIFLSPISLSPRDIKVAGQTIVAYQKAFEALLKTQRTDRIASPEEQKQFTAKMNTLLKIAKSELADK